MSESIINISNASKIYGRAWRKFEALRSVDLEIEKGSIFGLLGANEFGVVEILNP